MANGVKRAAEWLGAHTGAAALWRRVTATRAVVLAYHNIVPRGESAVGDLSLHLEQDDFAAQLDRLTETHEVIPLDSLPERAGADPDRPVAVITFDDGYVGAVTAGADELSARGLPATVFVCPGRAGGGGFWWDRLASDEGLAPSVRDHALWTLAGVQERVLEWAVGVGLKDEPLPEHARPADEETLVALGRTDGIALASHSWGHPNLAALERDEIDRELRRTQDWLEARGHGGSAWLAYPYGLSSDRVIEAARGIAVGALLVDGGPAHRRGRWTADALSLPRINVPRGLSLEGLELRLAGLLADR